MSTECNVGALVVGMWVFVCVGGCGRECGCVDACELNEMCECISGGYVGVGVWVQVKVCG